MSSTSEGLRLRGRPPLRFIHASDLHLNRTVERVLDAPSYWEDRLLDVSRVGAERLFQKVIEENVDFLILSGNVLNANLAAPNLFLFLLDQFERLKDAGITVYWAGGEFDSPDDWPTAFPLPENVHHFPCHSIQEYFYHRPEDRTPENPAGIPLAKIVGMSRNQQRRTIRSSEFPLDPGGLYTVAIANGQADPESLSQRRIDYWALGGSVHRETFHGNPRKKGPDGKPIPLDLPDVAPGSALGLKDRKRDIRDLPPQPYTVHYPGPTVARSPRDTGAFGATLVEVPWGEEPVLTFFPTSPIRWVNDQVTLSADDDGGALADEIRLRIKNYREAQRGDDLMISWFVDVPPGPLAASLRRSNFSADLLNELRSLYGQENPMTWSVSLTLLLPERLPESFYEQQTILGDFLRSVKHFQDEPREIIDLEPYLPKNWDAEDVVSRLLLADKVEIELKTRDDDSGEEEQDGERSKKVRLSQSPIQSANQQRILREAAYVGLELLGEAPKPFIFEARGATAPEESRDE